MPNFTEDKWRVYPLDKRIVSTVGPDGEERVKSEGMREVLTTLADSMSGYCSQRGREIARAQLEGKEGKHE